MKGLHQQSSLLSALTKQNVVPSDKAENISVDFIQQKKPFIRYLVEIKTLMQKLLPTPYAVVLAVR
jgi:type IV pilus assembly protein PilB